MTEKAPRTRPAKNAGERITEAKPKAPPLAAVDEVALLKARVYDLSALQQHAQAEIAQCNQRIAELGNAPRDVETPAAD